MPGCRHCGLDDCEAIFHECLDRDFSDPAFGVVHHLTVGAYLLQHRRYTREHERDMVDFLLDHLDRPPGEGVKREIRRSVDGTHRVISRGGDAEPGRPPRRWSPSIGDVDLTSAAAYRASVRAWAEAVARSTATE